jgi:hypothetical protein
MEVLEVEVRSCEATMGRRYRSFFVKRLEQHLQDQGLEVPHLIFDLFDKPFELFTDNDKKVYEERVKGQALFHIFSDMLIEIYARLEADRVGWETAANFLDDTPIKVCALHTLERIEELEEMPDEEDYMTMVEEFKSLSRVKVTPCEQKYKVRRYDDKKGHWWKKEKTG